MRSSFLAWNTVNPLMVEEIDGFLFSPRDGETEEGEENGVNLPLPFSWSFL